MAKRGQLEMFQFSTILGLVVAGILAITITQLTTKVVLSTAMEREYVAADVAMLLDTIYASPGDLDYVYSLPGNLYISVDKNLVIVADPQRNVDSKYNFATSRKFPMGKFVPEAPPNGIRILKKDGIVSLKPIYNNFQMVAIDDFEEFTEFLKANKDRHYSFKCAEEFSFSFPKGYYVVVGRGNSVLFYKSEESGEETQLLRGNTPDFSQLDSAARGDFFISTGWKPEISNQNGYNSKVLIVNEPKTGTWSWARQSTSLNELPRCEAEQLAKKGK
ncbi:hypothetical protein HYY72_05015 [Candidatus Woesearchaeota archaeon]|nr:hypothetical protein [Candidatus Woesearchaeota archaeon]